MEKAANAGLKVLPVTADCTAVNLKTFKLLGCKFAGTYDEFKFTLQMAKKFDELQKLQQQEGLNLAKKLSETHLKFGNHEMDVRLAAQTLSSSVANGIEFTGKSAELPNSSDSHGTVNFIRTIDR